MLESGNYLARIIDCGFSKTQTGKDQVFLIFEISSGEKISWYGGLATKLNDKGKSQAMYSIDQLLRLGFNNNWEAFGQSLDLSLIFEDIAKEFEIVVVHEEYNGKTSAKIKWINDPSASGVKKLEGPESVSLIRSMNLKAMTMQAKAEMKLKPQAKVTSQAKIDEDIPF